MKKSVIGRAPATGLTNEWLDLEQLASVEVTSEDPDFPIESAFISDQGPGWRAADAGRQVLRLVFTHPQPIRRIHLEFSETETARVQEFTLRWAALPNGSLKEIVRQQWNFSPQGSTTEVEDYSVDLPEVAILELTLTPDVSGGPAIASLAQWRVA